MKKIKHELIRDPVFRSETLFYTCKRSQAIKHANKKYALSIPDDDFNGYRGVCTEMVCANTGVIFWLVWVLGSKDWITMTHEAAHLTFNVLDKRGISYNSRNDETWCYLHEFFVKKFWHIMCKKRKIESGKI